MKFLSTLFSKIGILLLAYFAIGIAVGPPGGLAGHLPSTTVTTGCLSAGKPSSRRRARAAGRTRPPGSRAGGPPGPQPGDTATTPLPAVAATLRNVLSPGKDHSQTLSSSRSPGKSRA